MRKKRLILNILSSVFFQVITLICGFILPKLILSSFGSETNGLVVSITQFLGFITLLEMGVGRVVESSLYGPLAEQDFHAVSEIVASARKFFLKIAGILICYILILCTVFPFLSGSSFSWYYIDALVLIISISSLFQYLFGLVDRIILAAAQKEYISYSLDIVCIVTNTLVCALLIHLGAGIHTVKFYSAMAFLIGPVALHIYIKRHYPIDVHVRYTQEPIKQKWNGIAQHVASVVLGGTDVMVLTVFSTLSNVSVYAVYNMVIQGVCQLVLSMTTGIRALMGELMAKKEMDTLNHVFGWTEWAVHTGTVLIFGCTAVLIVPFVSVYTKGVTDTNYIQPLFAFLLTLANAGHCLRLPYNLMIQAGGHYKQTQSCYFMAAFLNVVLSILAVRTWGLVGIAVGTVIAMLYQTVWMAVYISRNLICWPFRNFLKQVFTDVVCFGSAYLLTIGIPLYSRSFLSWTFLAAGDFLIWLLILFGINFILYRDNVWELLLKFKKKYREL